MLVYSNVKRIVLNRGLKEIEDVLQSDSALRGFCDQKAPDLFKMVGSYSGVRDLLTLNTLEIKTDYFN